ncbi:hypothetical protein [Pseudomonas sp. 24 E 13]|nr:hypothetical protein [Pseudomonas sp. 24 E 13]
MVHVAHLRLHQYAALGHAQVFGVPLGIALGEAQAQRVVMLQHRQQGLLQAMWLEQLQRLEHQGLVPVLARRDVGVEEPMLDRRKARAAGEHTLLGAERLDARGDGGQALHGLVLEQVTRAEMNARLPRTADHLDRQDRIAAQLEEVIVEADLLQVQHRAPDGRQRAFQRIAWRHVRLAVRFRIGLRQGAPVELAVGGQRHAVEHDYVGGHHVVRQVRLEVGLHRVAQGAVLGVADQVRHQLFAARRIQRQHHRFTHRRMLQQARFDLAQFDAETANLHLMVDTPQVLHLPIGALAHQVTGTVQTAAIAAERVGDKALRRHAGALVIALSQARAADVQLAARALRHQGQVGVENVSHARADNAADRHAGGALLHLLRRQAGQRHHHGFGRTIGVEKHLRLERRTNTLQMLTGQCFTAGDAHAHRQGLLLRGQPLRQLAAVAGREPEDIHAMAADQRADLFGVPLALGTQYHVGTAEQRHQQALGGGVEVDRIKVQFAVVRAHAEALDHGLAMHGDFPLGHHHAFRLAGGAGGVDQVRLVLRQADKRQLIGRIIFQPGRVIFQAPARQRVRQLAQGLEHRRIAEQQADAAVFDHVVQAVQRVFRVQRHVGAAGLEDRQQADDHFQRAWQRQADPHLGADATFAQHPGQAIGAGIEFGVSEGHTGKGQRRRSGTLARLLAEQGLDALVQTMLSGCNPEAVLQGALLGGAEQRQFTEALVRIIDQCFQEVAPMRGHAGDARLVEQIGAVGQAATQAMVEVGDFQVEVELGGASIVGQVLDGHAGQLAALLKLPALHVAHHLEQRVVRRAARWLQRLHQMVERQVLMGLAFDHGVTHLLEQLRHTHLPIELATQHLGVEERTDQPFAFRADTVGHRRADAQVGLAAVAVEQHGQGSGHGHEQGQALFGVEGAYAGGQCIAQVEAVQLAAMTLHRRARAVAGQFEQRMFAAQLRGPVIQLALTLARFQPLALPHAVVQVLHRQRRQR